MSSTLSLGPQGSSADLAKVCIPIGSTDTLQIARRSWSLASTPAPGRPPCCTTHKRHPWMAPPRTQCSRVHGDSPGDSEGSSSSPPFPPPLAWRQGPAHTQEASPPRELRILHKSLPLQASTSQSVKWDGWAGAFYPFYPRPALSQARNRAEPRAARG